MQFSKRKINKFYETFWTTKEKNPNKMTNLKKKNHKLGGSWCVYIVLHSLSCIDAHENRLYCTAERKQQKKMKKKIRDNRNGPNDKILCWFGAFVSDLHCGGFVILVERAFFCVTGKECISMGCIVWACLVSVKYVWQNEFHFIFFILFPLFWVYVYLVYILESVRS